MNFNKRLYSKSKEWDEIENFNLDKIYVHYTWEPMFKQLYENKERKEKIETRIKDDLTKLDDKTKLYPKHDYIFRAFQLTNFNKLRVVIIGQDPYFNSEEYKEWRVPQAYGLSFSVPKDFTIPSSLKNIYANLKRFNHISKIPDHGCLDLWAYQGVLMLNTSLTVMDGDQNKNCHSSIWKSFTDDIIKYISDNCKGIIFVLWGAEAFKKVSLINLDSHEIVVSSHPSGLSCNKKMGTHDSFAEHDHFGKINRYLKKYNRNGIIWDLEF
jgi:uracil-DNA glycosylase